MKIGLLDTEFIDSRINKTLKTQTFFPNLALMKLSTYYKNKGDEVRLIPHYTLDLIESQNHYFETYDKIYVAKVFKKTYYPENFDKKYSDIIEKGGTGFFYDKSPFLPYEIEHIKPDYSLYKNLKSLKKYKHKEAMIGFLTRGCFRQCEFCVNRNYKKVVKASIIEEFWDESKKYIILLDDNFLGYSDWRKEIAKLKETKKPFQFNQGLDMRIMTEDKAYEILTSRYKGDYIFAFDHIADEQILDKKIKVWNSVKESLGKNLLNYDTKHYLFTGFDRKGEWSDKFFIQDIHDLLYRIDFLWRRYSKGYVMLYKNEHQANRYRAIYEVIKNWINSTSGNWNSETLMEFGKKTNKYRYLVDFFRENRDFKYFFEEMSWNRIHKKKLEKKS